MTPTATIVAPVTATGGGLEMKVSAATASTGGQDVTAPSGWPGRRHWLAVIGLALVLVSLLPPLDVLARRYVFAESIQFSVLAMAGPALVVLGAPWRFLRLSGPDQPGGGPAGWRPRAGPSSRSCGPRASCSPS